MAAVARSFVGRKVNKQWIWLALERETRQIVGHWIGPRDEEGALGLWFSIPRYIREKAHFYTDDWDAYGCVIDAKQLTQSKKEGQTGPRRPIIRSGSIIPSDKDVAVW